jgi:hypothetical protein
MRYLSQSRASAASGSDARQLPSWANSQADYDFHRRKFAADVLGKLLALIGMLHERGESGRGEGGTDAIGAVHASILEELKQVLHTEKQCFVELRRQGKVADSDVLVRLLEVVAPIFSCGTPKQAESIVSVINDVLCDEAVLPWDVSRAMSMEDRSTFAPLFSALLHLVRTSRSRAVLPFVEQHLLKVTLPV